MIHVICRWCGHHMTMGVEHYKQHPRCPLCQSPGFRPPGMHKPEPTAMADFFNSAHVTHWGKIGGMVE